jgi:hypothetical protein
MVYALRQAEGGTAVGDVCRTLGISEATFYVWFLQNLRLQKALEGEGLRPQPQLGVSSGTGRRCCAR